jgi:hypothetical protein
MARAAGLCPLRIGIEPRKGPPKIGRLAQLVERFVYTEDVGGSSPSSPTIHPRELLVLFYVRFRRWALQRPRGTAMPLACRFALTTEMDCGIIHAVC